MAHIGTTHHSYCKKPLTHKHLQEREEAEDAALLVDYTGSIAKGKGSFGQQATRQQPPSLQPPPVQPPASQQQHAQPAPKQRQSRKGGQFQSWSNPSRFSIATSKTLPPQLPSSMQLDDQQPELLSKHSNTQRGGQMLNIDIDDDIRGIDDQIVSDRQCRGSLLKFDIDDDDDHVNGSVSALMSGRQHGAFTPRFDIDDDEDDHPESASMFGRQHGRQGSSPDCRHGKYSDDDTAMHDPSHDPSRDPRHDPSHDLRHDPMYNLSHGPSRGPSHDPSHGPSHDPNQPGRKQEMPSALPLNFDIEDSDDDAAEAATDPLDPQVEATRGEICQKQLLHVFVFDL